MPVGEFDNIVTVSGDGLLFEVVNGIMARQDRAEFLKKVTIGAIPGGTGNGLVKSILASSQEEFSVEMAAYLVARGQRRCMDLTQLDLEYLQAPIYSFLSVAWAVVADCDINSEVIRWAGSARFTLWGVYRCLCIKKYRGSLTHDGERI